MVSDAELFAKALMHIEPRKLSPTAEAGGVGAALVTDCGNIYAGTCIDVACGIGFCAEHAAIAQMIGQGESHIMTIVSVHRSKTILPPCGRCRELIAQVHPDNLQTRILLENNKVKLLSELLPDNWTVGIHERRAK